jgi:hypothetical protein
MKQGWDHGYFLMRGLEKVRTDPRSRGYGRQQRIMPRGRSLVPGRVNTHSLTNKEMLFPDAMHVQDRPMVYGVVDQRHWRQEVKHHDCCGEGSQSFVAGYGLVMITQIKADLPLDHRIHQ